MASRGRSRTAGVVASGLLALLTAAAAPPAADEPSKPAKPAEKSAETPPAAAPEEPAAKPAEKPVPTEAKPAPPKLPISSPILTIKLAFMSDPRLLPYDIGVSVKAETVELSGKVGSEEDKRAAAEIAQKLESTKKVKNELHVAKEFANAAQKRQDEAITEYVRERFKKSTILDNAHFDVKTVDGIVSLSGKTRYQVIIFEAAEAARQVPGVIAVRTDGIQLEGS